MDSYERLVTVTNDDIDWVTQKNPDEAITGQNVCHSDSIHLYGYSEMELPVLIGN